MQPELKTKTTIDELEEGIMGIKTVIFGNLKKIDFAKYAPLIALVVLVLLSALASEHFLKFRNITNILRQVSYTGTIALGMTFVIVAAGIDLSVGSMVAFIGVLTIYLMKSKYMKLPGILRNE